MGKQVGSNRNAGLFRSNFSENEIETFVNLKFSHKGKIYEIKRNPAYEKSKKYKEGKTNKASDAFIDCNGVTLVTGYKAVTEKVIQILGVTENQFKQIAMLAQRRIFKNFTC